MIAGKKAAALLAKGEEEEELNKSVETQNNLEKINLEIS